MNTNVLFLFTFFIYCCTFSQGEKSFLLEIRPKTGFLMAHRGVMGHMPRELAFGGEMSILFQVNGRKQWHHDYNFPNVGVTLYSSTVGNRELLGTQHGAFAFFEYPFLKSKNAEFTGKLGSGLSYGTKVFDQETNPKNVAMSTHVNALISLGVYYRYFIKDYHLVSGIDMTHMSNGATKVPNLGINLPYFSLGIGKRFGEKKEPVIATETINSTWEFSAIGVFSVKEVFPSGRRKFPVYSLSAMAYKKTGAKSGVEFMTDFMYKTSISAYKTNLYPDKKKSEFFQLGLYCGYTLPLDKFRFVLGMGAYVRDVYNPDDLFYHRIGMRYKIKEHFMLNLVLKSHWARADYVEYGIGYVF
jgi:hypothetical protein